MHIHDTCTYTHLCEMVLIHAVLQIHLVWSFKIDLESFLDTKLIKGDQPFLWMAKILTKKSQAGHFQWCHPPFQQAYFPPQDFFILKLFAIVCRFGQCDQIGRFLKVLGNKLAYESSPKRLANIWAI